MAKYRSIFISDIHLGMGACRADDLCAFLKNNECDHLYLVGDIIDGWKIKRNFRWPQSHSNVVRRLLTKAKRNTKITYITGNHDEFLREWVRFGLEIGDISVVNQCKHVGVDGKRYLVTHGDMFDAVTVNHKWVSLLGDVAYTAMIKANVAYNAIRARFGFGYWSLSAWLKQQAKQAVNFIFSFEQHLSNHARSGGYDGVICGHIHTPEIKMIDGVIYLNDGCWVENCSAIVETEDGVFTLLIMDHDRNMREAKKYDPRRGEIL